MFIGRGFEGFPVGYSSDFCFHKLLILNRFLFDYFLCFCNEIVEKCNKLCSVTVNLSRINCLQILRNVTEYHFSVFFAAKSGIIVKRVDESIFYGVF